MKPTTKGTADAGASRGIEQAPKQEQQHQVLAADSEVAPQHQQHRQDLPVDSEVRPHQQATEEAWRGKIVAKVAEVNAKISALIEKNFLLNLECDGLKTELAEMTAAAQTLVRGVINLRAENSKLRDDIAGWSKLSTEHYCMQNDTRTLVNQLVSDRMLMRMETTTLRDEMVDVHRKLVEEAKSACIIGPLRTRGCLEDDY